ncbi:spermidine N1-acetyltransferase [Neisseriaceae bacterium PsAf]|nr:spermidine N1-acetyltransferase [Neisseriaceae bacterium PsAf]MCV2502874.1 spermidine N1-acetyltransferase [Neisseriaceae bacterium]
MSDEQSSKKVVLRSLERVDLPYVHKLDNNQSVMRYWFEEPYAAYVELEELYDKHIHDQSERRFILEHNDQKIGLVELMEIDYVHRSAEFALIIAPEHQGKGYAKEAVYLISEFAFSVLNLHKLYLVVDEENKKAMHIYEKAGFVQEGRLIDEYFSNGSYHTVIRMAMFQEDFFRRQQTVVIKKIAS